MKKVISIIILVGLQAAFLYQLKGNFTPKKEKEVYPFELTFTDGKVSKFTKDNFPEDLILYYFTPDCKLCFSEVNEVVSYAKKKDIAVLFVTVSELNDVRSFSLELKRSGMEENETSIARIKEEDVATIFGQIAAPQCVLYGKGLQVKGVREGIITSHFLAKAFK